MLQSVCFALIGLYCNWENMVLLHLKISNKAVICGRIVVPCCA